MFCKGNKCVYCRLNTGYGVAEANGHLYFCNYIQQSYVC